MLRGSYEGTTVEFPVVVEIGAGEMVHEDFADASSLPVTASSAVTQMRFDSSILPDGWSDGNTLVFDLNTGRAPNIVIDHSMRFFGLPDSVSMQIKTGIRLSAPYRASLPARPARGYIPLLPRPTATRSM